MTAPALTVAPMTHADIPAVAAIAARAFPVPWSPNEFEDELHRAHSRCCVLRSGGAIVGYAVAWRVADEVEILHIAVDPSHRRSGYGRLLLTDLVEREGQAGASAFYLEVRASNTAAQGLYASAGFEQVGVRKSYYKTPCEDAILMRSS